MPLEPRYRSFARLGAVMATFGILGVLFASFASPAADARPVPSAALKHSASHPPQVSASQFRKLDKAKVEVSFEVRYPRVGRLGAERVRLVMRVFRDGSRARTSVKRVRRVGISADRSANYRFVVRGTPARRILRKLRTPGGPAAKGIVGLTVIDRRNIVPGSGIDHVVIATSKSGGDKVTLLNATGDFTRTVASKVSCLYSDGFAGLQGQLLDPGAGVGGPGVARTGNAVTTELHPDNSGRGSEETWEPPAVAAQFINPEQRALAFQVWSQAKGGAAPKYEFVDSYIGEYCDDRGHKMVALGLDDLENGAHNFNLWDLKGGELNIADYLEGKIGIGVDKGHDTDGIVRFESEPFPATTDSSGNCLWWNWMVCAYPTGSAAEANARLMDVVWPGTHDSGTAALSTEDSDLYKVKSSCTAWGEGGAVAEYFEEAEPQDVQKLAVAQTDSLREQLDSGIRYLDIRSAWNPNSGQWQIVHTMFSRASLMSEMESVAVWAGHHPSEVIILDLNHICGSTPQNIGGFFEALEASQSNYDVPGKNEFLNAPSICDRTYPTAPGLGAALATRTVAEVRRSGGNIVLLAGENSNYPANAIQNCNLNLTAKEPVTALRAMSFFHATDPQLPPSANTKQQNCINQAIAHMPFAERASCAVGTTQSTYVIENEFTGGNPWPPRGLTIANRREPGKPPMFVITDLHYEMATGSEIFAALRAGGLWKYEKPLLPTVLDWDRTRIIDAWGSCANIIAADDFNSQLVPGHSNDYVNQLAQINQNPSAHPCHDPGAPEPEPEPVPETVTVPQPPPPDPLIGVDHVPRMGPDPRRAPKH
jgi:hypothetical protein